VSNAILIIAGLVGLIGGAELLVRGGTGLALRLGIAPIVTGVTVVSLGTSMPELANGIDAARQGSAGLAVGILVGTNLVNLLLVLGLSALISPSRSRPEALLGHPSEPAAVTGGRSSWTLQTARRP